MKRFALFNTIILLLLLSFSLMPRLAAAATVGLDTIVAVVNGTAITNSQLNDQMKFSMQQMQASHEPIPQRSVFRQQVLKRLVDTELQLQVAKRNGLNIPDTAVSDAIGRIATQNGITVAELKGKLAEQGINFTRYQKEIHNQMVISQLQEHAISPHINVSEQEVTDFLRTHGKELSAPHHNEAATGVYRVHAMVIPLTESATPEQVDQAKKAATKALAQLQGGESPQQLATSKLGVEYNIQEHDFGWLPLAQLPDLYISHVRNLHPGNFAGPIHAPNGFHLLKVMGVQGVEPAHKDLEETHVRHILLKTTPLETDSQVKVRLDRLRASILGGADFAKIAVENSQDPGSASKGGDLGWVKSGALDPAFEEVMNKTNPGQISQPFKGHFGWHVLQVLGRKAITDQQVLRRHQAHGLVFQQKYNKELEHWLARLRKAEYVKIMGST